MAEHRSGNMSEVDDRDMALFFRELQYLKLENESLRLQLEKMTIEKQLSELTTMPSPRRSPEPETRQERLLVDLPDVPQASSTPYVPTEVHRGFKHTEVKGLSKKPCGTPKEVTRSLTLDCDQTCLGWDRFVTKRKKVTVDDDRLRTNMPDFDCEDRGSGPKKDPKVYVKPATFDGSGSWLDYIAHFEACSEINGWTEKQKGLYLAVSLRGQAQGVFGNLSSEKHSYDQLTRALEERFSPPNQTELYRAQLRDRRQRASETLSEMGQDIRRLTNLAYSSAPADVRETLAKEQFIDSISSSDMRLRIKQSRPTSLNDAVRHAVELEAFNRAEKKTLESQGLLRSVRNSDTPSKQKPNEEIESLKKSMDEIKATMKSLQSQLGVSNNTRFTRKPFTCYECGQEGHSKRYCPELRQSHDNAQGNFKVAGSVKRSSCTGSGLYVEAKINGTPAKCLIDTGSTLTVVSSKFMESIQALSSLESFKHNIFTASGTVMQSIGRTSVIIKVGRFETLVNVLVANIDAEVILGLDYIKSQGIVIDIANENMVIQEKVFKMNCVGPIGCSRVRVCNLKVCYEKRFKCDKGIGF